MRAWTMGALVLAMGLGCGGVGDLVEGVQTGVEELVADQIAQGLAKALNVSQDEVDIHKEGDRWKVEVPHVEGDCGLGADVDDAGLPLEMGDLIARCDVTLDGDELYGDDVPKGLGDRFDVAVRSAGDRDATLASRRADLEGKGWKVLESGDKEATTLVALDGRLPVAVVIIGSGDGAMEVLAVPKDAKPERDGGGRDGGGGHDGGGREGKAGKGKAGKRR